MVEVMSGRSDKPEIILAMTKIWVGGGRGANYIADIHLDVANSAKRAFNAVSLRHRLRDISTLT